MNSPSSFQIGPYSDPFTIYHVCIHGIFFKRTWRLGSNILWKPQEFLQA